ncbi:PA14 domain-containing protein [Streptomyces sp. DT2A-34]|uniref:PA14 domain-containing protein n=1 Tax=Streptomyces sp. DT2A-34 TaxID=3051182 RepID=UPI00265C2205|nr:PA14 domain-containing protein [Streptomyces sp. DT2A-34]MDO0913169.1 PA14 domain-containing protein [Streptomyces sp. DT2A-34]
MPFLTGPDLDSSSTAVLHSTRGSNEPSQTHDRRSRDDGRARHRGTLLATTPASAAVTCASPVFKRQFFANTTFSGTPKKTDCDSAIDQSWSGAPATGLPKDNFGVRWTLTRDFGSGGPFSFAASGLDGIRVYLDGVRKIDMWKNVSTTVSKTVNVTIPSGKHTLRVDYVNWTGSAKVKFGYTPRTSATVDTVKPLTPTGTSLSYDAATGKAKLTWAKNKEMDLAGYRVFRRLKGSAYPGKPLATTTSTSYTDTPPPTGETYYYEVRAYDNAGNESAGTADQPVTTVDRTGPAAPTGLSAHGDLWGMMIDWDAAPDAVSYELFEKDPATGTHTLVKQLTDTSFIHYVGHNKTQHTYVVRALDAAGNASGYSVPVTSDGIDRTPPDAPQNLRAKVTSSTVYLYWNAPEDPTSVELANDARFTVLRSGTTPDVDTEIVNCAVNESLNTQAHEYSFACADEDFELDTTYTYEVTLTDWQGNRSAPSNPVTVTTADRVAPLPLTGLTATPRADGTELRWNAPADDDIASYRALRGVRQDDGSVKWIGELAHCADDAEDPLAMLCIDIPDGETYVYTVLAEDVWGNELSASDPSVPTVTATELNIVPGEPIGQDFEAGGPLYGAGGWTVSESAKPIQWHCSGDICAQITEYRVSRWNPETQSYDLLGTASPTTDYYQSYGDVTQPLGSVSYYRVVGLLADGTETAAAHPWKIRPDLL